MNESEIFHADWCRSLFAMLREGGAWGVPRSGLLFRKRGETLTLDAQMPHDPAMPLTETELAEYQDADYELIRRHFAAAGITVTRD